MAHLQVGLSLDADFLVSAGLHEKLSSAEASAALLEDVSIQRNVVVLPAFETETSLGLEKGGDIANLAQRCKCPSGRVSCYLLALGLEQVQGFKGGQVGNRSPTEVLASSSDVSLLLLLCLSCPSP